MDEKLHWVKVANFITELSFGANAIAEADADGRRICIARFKDHYFAFAHKCPHASGQFVNGYVDALGNVVCPLHRYKFCLANGRNVSGEGYHLKHWPVKVEATGVFVGFEQKSLLIGI
jgi:3-phenylpropionate/trans-cinnamate dioxygenase ferredoxin subunit